MVTQDTNPSHVVEVCDEYLFGPAKTGGLGQLTMKKNDEEEEHERKKTDITRPPPDGGVTRMVTTNEGDLDGLQMTNLKKLAHFFQDVLSMT